MWDRLQKQIGVEREQLNRLLEIHRPLLVTCSETPPSDIELSALATMLHSFYTGNENIFKRIVAELGDTLPRSEFWHRELLDMMTRPSEAREAVISETLRDRLREYLGFRHVFRQAYSFQLKWEKMSSLVLECEDTLRRLETELDAFLRPAQDSSDA